jgi:hypothetical protein
VALRNGASFDLLDEEQQMAYARVANKQTVIVVFNNDTKSVNVQFDVSMLKSLGSNNILTDRLGKIPDVKIENGNVNFSMPARTAGIFTVK